MKCKYCGQIFRTPVEDRRRNDVFGDFSPAYWQNEYSLTDEEVRSLGFDPKDNSSFICYDCDSKFYNLNQEKAKADLDKWRNKDGHVVIKLGNKFHEQKMKESKTWDEYVALDKSIEQLFTDAGINVQELHTWEEEETEILHVEFDLSGDWKHDHIRAVNIMTENGWEMDEKQVEPSDSDWYTAHYMFTNVETCRKWVSAHAVPNCGFPDELDKNYGQVYGQLTDEPLSESGTQQPKVSFKSFVAKQVPAKEQEEFKNWVADEKNIYFEDEASKKMPLSYWIDIKDEFDEETESREDLDESKRKVNEMARTVSNYGEGIKGFDNKTQRNVWHYIHNFLVDLGANCSWEEGGVSGITGTYWGLKFELKFGEDGHAYTINVTNVVTQKLQDQWKGDSFREFLEDFNQLRDEYQYQDRNYPQKESVKKNLKEDEDYALSHVDWDALEFEVKHLLDCDYDEEEIAYYIFEENDIDQLNELGFIGDSFTVKYDIEKAVHKVIKEMDNPGLEESNNKTASKLNEGSGWKAQFKKAIKERVVELFQDWVEEDDAQSMVEDFDIDPDNAVEGLINQILNNEFDELHEGRYEDYLDDDIDNAIIIHQNLSLEQTFHCSEVLTSFCWFAPFNVAISYSSSVILSRVNKNSKIVPINVIATNTIATHLKTPYALTGSLKISPIKNGRAIVQTPIAPKTAPLESVANKPLALLSRVDKPTNAA